MLSGKWWRLVFERLFLWFLPTEMFVKLLCVVRGQLFNMLVGEGSWMFFFWGGEVFLTIKRGGRLKFFLTSKGGGWSFFLSNPLLKNKRGQKWKEKKKYMHLVNPLFFVNFDIRRGLIFVWLSKGVEGFFSHYQLNFHNLPPCHIKWRLPNDLMPYIWIETPQLLSWFPTFEKVGTWRTILQ